MDIYRDPDQVIKEVEQNEERREDQAEVEKEIDNAPGGEDADEED